MNTEKTLNEKFTARRDYPIWYYKELNEVEVDYVIWNLLKETFVVDINGSKHEITFGKNRKDEICQCIKYDDIMYSNLTSYKVVEKGFKEGKWFTITDIDTTDEFKTNYVNRKTQYEKEETKQWYKQLLNNVVRVANDLTEEQKTGLLQSTENISYEELEGLVNTLFGKLKDNTEV